MSAWTLRACRVVVATALGESVRDEFGGGGGGAGLEGVAEVVEGLDAEGQISTTV